MTTEEVQETLDLRLKWLNAFEKSESDIKTDTEGQEYILINNHRRLYLPIPIQYIFNLKV